jgi:hypothetical protein
VSQVQKSDLHEEAPDCLFSQPTVRYFAAMAIILAQWRLPTGSSFFRERGPFSDHGNEGR